MKCYMILEKTFDYNDEIYYNESGGGFPCKEVFTSKEKAEQELLKITLDFMIKKDLSQYGYDIEEVFDTYRINLESLNEVRTMMEDEDSYNFFGVRGDWREPKPSKFGELLGTLNKEELNVLVNAFVLKPYKIVEVELVD